MGKNLKILVGLLAIILTTSFCSSKKSSNNGAAALLLLGGGSSSSSSSPATVVGDEIDLTAAFGGADGISGSDCYIKLRQTTTLVYLVDLCFGC